MALRYSDGLWPRGVTKADTAINREVKYFAPSTVLRKRFRHYPYRPAEFRCRYATEVQQRPEQLSRLRVVAKRGPITLDFAAHGEVHSDAIALRNFLFVRPTKRNAETTRR